MVDPPSRRPWENVRVRIYLDHCTDHPLYPNLTPMQREIREQENREQGELENREQGELENRTGENVVPVLFNRSIRRDSPIEFRRLQIRLQMVNDVCEEFEQHFKESGEVHFSNFKIGSGVEVCEEGYTTGIKNSMDRIIQAMKVVRKQRVHYDFFKDRSVYFPALTACAIPTQEYNDAVGTLSTESPDIEFLVAQDAIQVKRAHDLELVVFLVIYKNYRGEILVNSFDGLRSVCCALKVLKTQDNLLYRYCVGHIRILRALDGSENGFGEDSDWWLSWVLD